MSYQVLARKWRPANFDEMVGQVHVLRALSSALETERLHHAYLFSGTRGVGKTTISRILARCLNCEQGISAKPCGNCSACNEISEGRFVDLIEVDAASRTKVEDTRELLENVQYRPTRGRYKVYLIDEVHMLSNHSFNALLKTLEEPPPHVVFLLATTDPQKLPATVLSRCLQFNLKNMQPEDISKHLSHILDTEDIIYEQPALDSLAWSAKGSMRDALSLLDQAIAFGDGKVTDEDVREMLGSIDRNHLYRIISALAANDGATVMAVIDEFSQFSPDYEDLLAEMLIVLHRMALIQQIPDASIATKEREQIVKLAAAIPAEDVQLFYQLALHARRDLPLAPDMRSGFEMSMLRLMSFRPASPVKPMSVNNSPGENPVKKPESSLPEVENNTQVASNIPEDFQPVIDDTVKETVEEVVKTVEEAEETIIASPFSSNSIRSPLVRDQQRSPLTERPDTLLSEPEVESPPQLSEIADTQPQEIVVVEPEVEAEMEQSIVETPASVEDGASNDELPGIKNISSQNWYLVINKTNITGVTEQMAINSQFIGFDGEQIQLSLDHHVRSLVNPEHINKLTAAINALYNSAFTITITEAEPDYETPKKRRERIRNERHQEACDNLNADPQVQALLTTFDARLEPETVETLLPEKL